MVLGCVSSMLFCNVVVGNCGFCLIQERCLCYDFGDKLCNFILLICSDFWYERKLESVFSSEFLFELLWLINIVCWFVGKVKFSGLVSVLFFGDVINSFLVLMVIGLVDVNFVLLCCGWVSGVFINVFRLLVVLIVWVLVW